MPGGQVTTGADGAALGDGGHAAGGEGVQHLVQRVAVDAAVALDEHVEAEREEPACGGDGEKGPRPAAWLVMQACGAGPASPRWT